MANCRIYGNFCLLQNIKMQNDTTGGSMELYSNPVAIPQEGAWDCIAALWPLHINN